METPVNLQPLNFSRTQRLVLLVDLDPLLSPQNPSSYLAAVISAADRLLRFPPLSATLSAFKLFFSSFSPLRTAAALPHHLYRSLSFSLPTQTLDSLSTTLKSASTLIDLANSARCARASFAASSLLQLIHDYAWEPEKDNLLSENNLNDDGAFVEIPSNLVILLSPIYQSVNCSVNYLESCEFTEVFRPVSEAFAARDIHLCWVDVKNYELEIAEVDEKEKECGDKLVIVRDGIREMGWGFCSSDLIILGSALLPSGLIYPRIGVSFDFVDFGRKRYIGELNLEVLGLNGIPLECKCCDLEFVNLKSLSSNLETVDIFDGMGSRDSHVSCSQDALQLRIGDRKLKLRVKSVHRHDECGKTGGSSIVLVRELFQDSKKNKKKIGDEFFADKVLEMLQEEMSGLSYRNEIPTWQIFLSFLHMKGYWASVSLLSSSGDTIMGSLQPFTAHLGILCISDAGHVSFKDKSVFNGDKMNGSNMWSGSQTNTSTSGHCEQYRNGRRKRGQKNLYQEMTMSSFRKEAFGGYDCDLFELYASRYLQKSKKLKFLKCWMKQISRVDQCLLPPRPGSKTVDNSSDCNALSSEPTPVEEGVMLDSLPENSETFLNNLSKSVDHGLESGMDLQKLAERVVKSSVHWLRHKYEKENNSEGQESIETSDDSSSEAFCEELVELLLRSPKNMKKIHQDPSPSSSPEHIVREYELEILLRMEILRSDVSAMMEESRKQKLLKQIYSLLEIIQYLVAGGIHGHISLYDYVERTIRTRYGDELEDVVKKIYSEMDLLPFGEEDEAPCLMFNSEDSNQSWRDIHDRNEKAEASSINLSVSTEGDSSQPPAACNIPEERGGWDDYTQSLNEARERRERARKSASFISKALDLQRVWAPKQPPKGKNKCKFDHPTNKSKRKKRETPYSVVMETPMSRNKLDRGYNDHGNCVSKALFQDTDDYSN